MTQNEKTFNRTQEFNTWRSGLTGVLTNSFTSCINFVNCHINTLIYDNKTTTFGFCFTSLCVRVAWSRIFESELLFNPFPQTGWQKVAILQNKKAQLTLTNPRDAKTCKNCSNSTCICCHWQYWPIFIRLAVVASEICEIPRNSLKIQTYRVQGHPRSSILVSIESPCTTSY